MMAATKIDNFVEILNNLYTLATEFLSVAFLFEKNLIKLKIVETKWYTHRVLYMKGV